MKDKFYISDGKLIFCYIHDYYDKNSLLKNLYEKKEINLKGLYVSRDNLIEDDGVKEKFNQLVNNNEEYYDDTYGDFSETLFHVGNVVGDYVFLDKNVFNIEFDFAIQHQLLLDDKIDKSLFFIYTSDYRGRTNVISIVSEYANCNCFIVEDNSNKIGENGYIPFSEYKMLISNFPTKTELKKYQMMRISSIIEDYFDDSNYTQKYNDYMNKKYNKTFDFSANINEDYDISMYSYIINELDKALDNINISEEEWQNKLVPLIRLLYPRYVICLSKIPIVHNDNYDNTKELDCLLVDIEGNCCILELKKPFTGKKLLSNSYRKNFYQPKFELAGGVQQIEEYIYDLNLYKKENIKSIMKKYSNELNGINVNLVDVQGILICGRSNDFSNEEKRDFEIIRKQYKNIVDILTYDDILQRLKKTIDLFRKKQSENDNK